MRSGLVIALPIVIVKRCERPIASYMTSTAPVYGLSSELSAQYHLKRLNIDYGFSEQLPEGDALLFNGLEPLHFGGFHASKLLAPDIEGSV